MLRRQGFTRASERKQMKFLPNHILIAVAVCGAALGVFGIYRWGYTAAEVVYRIELAKQQAAISQLEHQERLVEKEVVVKYVDRVRVVTKVEQQILEVGRDILQQESSVCDIGDNFIWLHNQSASNQAISNSTSGVDAATEPIKDAAQ